MPEIPAYSIDSPTGSFAPATIVRREPGPTEVYIDIAYAGICHSDIHTARGEWGPTTYPLVPGHEIAGVVSAVGSAVTKFAVGDRVGVGCFVDSCGACDSCRAGDEQFCTGDGGTVWTYDSVGRDGLPTAGGYSAAITVEQDYVCRIPDSIPLDQAAPLLCAGITLYDPLRRYGAGPGMKVAIVGMGGLGHMGVQIAAAMGAEVSVISRTRSKEQDGIALGASHYYATTEPDTYRSLRGQFDLIVSTVSETQDFTKLIGCLRTGGTLVNVGLPEHPVQLSINALGHRKSIAGSLIGGIAETQEMLDFCAAHGIAARIETIPASMINEAYDRVVASDVRYRFVIDGSTFGA